MPDLTRTISRRDCLLAGLALAVGPRLAGAADALEAIRDKGRAAKLGPFEVSETEMFRGIGDAPAAFRDEALGVCEAVAADYRKHFTQKGFEVATPKEKMLIVVLSSPGAYAAFEAEPGIAEAIGGHFDLEDNWQVTFDFRPRGAGATASAERINTFTLVHETIHQLTYNTGLLDRANDIPLAISEGLATYGETWRPRHRGEIGQANRDRLAGLRRARWIPIAKLLAEDGLLEAEETRDAAYAESWLLAHAFLKDSARVPKFRAYLDALRKKPDPKKREEVAREHLGDLDRLDHELRLQARRST